MVSLSRHARALASSSSSSPLIKVIHKSAAESAPFLATNSPARWCSSSSSTQPEKKPKDRLSAVIDAVPADDTLYRILSKNGCAPEWVELSKEIRARVSEWRLALKKAWNSKCSGDHSEWNEGSEVLKSQLRDINDKVSGTI